MKTFHFEKLDSTNQKAKELLQANASPLIVFADEQFAGRGQQGKSWQSPKGNLYFSVVIPGPKDPVGLTKIPLQVGSLIARFFTQLYQLDIKLKWPNDLYLGGCKLGGILCESVGGKVVVGVGLNVSVVPDNLDQAAIQIASVRPKIDLNQLRADLIEHWQRLWHEVEDVVETYEKYAYPPGTIVADKTGRQRLDGYDKKIGGINIVDLQSNEFKNLVSASHNLRVRTSEENFIAADCGNSRLKLGIYEVERERWRWESFAYENLEEVETFLAKVDADLPVHVLSVSSLATSKLTSMLERPQISIRRQRLRVSYPTYDFSQIGLDRVAALEGAAYLFPNQDLTVVSAGTATTIDLLSAKGEHRGGWIVPGVGTMLQSLSDNAEGLPNLAFKQASLEPGSDTKSAMLNGVSLATLAAIGSNASAKVVLCGGFASQLSELGSFELRLQEDLIFHGIRQLSL